MPHLPFCNCIIAASGGRCQRRPEEVRKPWTSEKPDKQTKEYACEKNKLCRIDKNDEKICRKSRFSVIEDGDLTKKTKATINELNYQLENELKDIKQFSIRKNSKGEIKEISIKFKFN